MIRSTASSRALVPAAKALHGHREPDLRLRSGPDKALEYSSAWHGLVEQLRDRDVDAFIQRNALRIENDARLNGVDRRILETQIRLHLPAFSREQVVSAPPRRLYRSLRRHAIQRARDIGDASRQAAKWSGPLLCGDEVLRRDLSITLSDGPKIGLQLRSVKPSVGHLYQQELHYLQCPRTDTILEFGLHVADARVPISYLGFSACDRPYMLCALAKAGVDVKREEVLVLTRVHGLPRAPRGLMSLTISHAVRAIRASLPHRLIVTACNPMLGFRGTVFLAAGFVPFATAPVTYRYDEQGRFMTRRNGGAMSHPQRMDTPYNMLAVLGIDRRARRWLSSIKLPSEITPAEYRMEHSTVKLDDFVRDGGHWRARLLGYRRRLQSGWSIETIHPSYRATYQDGGSPRGQCGVSSVWLARELRQHGVEATYCYGSLSIDGQSKPAVDHHCWLEIGGQADPNRMIVDITCDQADGIDEPVLCESYRRLEENGFRYEARSRHQFDELSSDHVWPRFIALRDAIEQPRQSESVAICADDEFGAKSID